MSSGRVKNTILFRITFEEINERWMRSQLNETGDEIPLRTFHNHRKAIEQMFDINIECDKRDGYVYYIENSEDMERGGVRSWLLNTFAVNNLINESHKIKERIQFEMLSISNHTACRFTKKRNFFRSLRAGRRCDAASRFNFFKGETLQTIARSCIRLKKRAGEGMGGSGGRGTPLALAEGFPFPPPSCTGANVVPSRPKG